MGRYKCCGRGLDGQIAANQSVELPSSWVGKTLGLEEAFTWVIYFARGVTFFCVIKELE